MATSPIYDPIPLTISGTTATYNNTTTYAIWPTSVTPTDPNNANQQAAATAINQHLQYAMQNSQLGALLAPGLQQLMGQAYNHQLVWDNTTNAQQVMQTAPGAFMPEVEGDYDEHHASLPRGMHKLLQTSVPEAWFALLRQAFEGLGIKFDSSMGAPPTLKDLQGQLLGTWAFWEDEVTDCYCIRQKVPRIVGKRMDYIVMDDIEETFEVEMTAALTRLVNTLAKRDGVPV